MVLWNGVYLQLFSRYCILSVLGYEFDFSVSRDVIDHVTVGFPIGHFLFVVLWNQGSIRHHATNRKSERLNI